MAELCPQAAPFAVSQNQGTLAAWVSPILTGYAAEACDLRRRRGARMDPAGRLARWLMEE